MTKKRQDKARATTPPEHGVRFDVEADAETLFKQAIDQIGRGDAKFQIKDETTRQQSRAKPKPAEVKIDLHGMTLDHARRHVDDRINEVLVGLPAGAVATVRIVTGKGLGSGAGGGVLAREIPAWVRDRFARHIVDMDESPADVQLGGIPLRGSFRVKLKG